MNRLLRVNGIVFSAMLAFAASGCGSDRGAEKLPIGNLDVPKAGESIKDSVRLSGWALSEKGIDRIDTYLDRDLVGSSHTGTSRPDVAAVHPEFADGAKAGFDYKLDLSGKMPGNHILVVQARSADGGVRELGVVPVAIKP